MAPDTTDDEKVTITERKIKAVVTKRKLNEFDEKMEDLRYWLSRPVKERLEAVTFLVAQSLTKGQRMDKTVVVKKQMKP